MALLRTQIFTKLPNDLARDGISNTVYHLANGVTPIDPIDATQICTDIKDVFQASGIWAGWSYDVRTYDNDEPKGTPPLARVTGTYTGSTAAAKGPREVALCLSYRTDPPYTSRRRGRIYIGPFAATTITGDRPTSSNWNNVLAIGNGLAGIGGENVSWRIHSVKNNDNHHIRQIWVDNAWDTIRGRGQAPTSRVMQDV